MMKAKKLINTVVTALNPCPECRGVGEIGLYTQGCNEILKGRAVVGYTQVDVSKPCDRCRGTGRK